MTKERILVVEDGEDIQELVRFHLAREGFDVETRATGEDGIAAARANPPDLVVLDLMLPGVDGLEVCRVLRGDEKTASSAIVMLTAKGEESDIVTGLELGADDYVTKPFSPRVLVARIKSVLRRRGSDATDESPRLTFDGLAIDPRRHEVSIDGAPAKLTATEFRILHFLARRPGWVFTRYQIVDGAHGPDYPVTDRSIDFQMVGLRRKLGDYASLIETVRGVGYRFKD